MVEIKDGEIKDTQLGVCDHGIFTFMITVYYSPYHQGFGGYAMDRREKDMGRRIGTAYGLDSVMQLLKAMGVRYWEELPGLKIKCHIDRGRIIAIEKESVFNLEEHAKMFSEENAELKPAQSSDNIQPGDNISRFADLE